MKTAIGCERVAAAVGLTAEIQGDGELAFGWQLERCEPEVPPARFMKTESALFSSEAYARMQAYSTSGIVSVKKPSTLTW